MRQLPVACLLLCCFAAPAVAENHAIGLRAGLLGAGVEYSYRLSDKITVRGGLNGSGISTNETESGIDYALDLDFDSLSIGVDVHPLEGKFRVSAGLLKNDSGLNALGQISQTVTIGDTVYQASDVGVLRGRVGFDSTAPFVGVGLDFLHHLKVGVSVDFGVVKQGEPDVLLSASGPISTDPDFMTDLAAEQAELQDSFDDFDVYPYAMVGVVFRF